MSRIEEALKRAAANTGGPAPNGPAPDPTADVFRDPWAVADGLERDTVTAAPPEPEPPPVDVPFREAPMLEATPPPNPMPPTPLQAPPQATTQAEPEPTRPHPNAPEPRLPEPKAPEIPAAAPALALFQGFDPSVSEKIVATPDIRPAFVEQYRKLAGVLHHQQLGTNIKVVMVTSAVAGEGKSLTATNLALTFSESYRRNVLLIDGDLRRPTLHDTFQVPNTSGLGDGLRAEREEKLSLVQVSPRLTLLTAGRPDPDPMSGLTSERMRRVIDEAATRFEWIIIDTPPVGLLPDARLLAEMADTTLLVINAGRTPYPFIRRAIDSIGRERIFGVVLNRAEMDAVTAGYHYYRYYDSYSRDSEEDKHPVHA